MTRSLVFAVLLAACHPAAPPQPRSFPALPDTIYTSSGAVPVVVVDSIGATDSTMHIGAYDPLANRLYVLARVSDPKMRRKTLEHERCHVVLVESGLDMRSPRWFVELLCDAFANAAVAQLERGRHP